MVPNSATETHHIWRFYSYLTHFQSRFYFYTPLKTSENRRGFDVFRGCRIGAWVENGFTIIMSRFRKNDFFRNFNHIKRKGFPARQWNKKEPEPKKTPLNCNWTLTLKFILQLSMTLDMLHLQKLKHSLITLYFLL